MGKGRGKERREGEKERRREGEKERREGVKGVRGVKTNVFLLENEHHRGVSSFFVVHLLFSFCISFLSLMQLIWNRQILRV